MIEALFIIGIIFYAFIGLIIIAALDEICGVDPEWIVYCIGVVFWPVILAFIMFFKTIELAMFIGKKIGEKFK